MRIARTVLILLLALGPAMLAAPVDAAEPSVVVDGATLTVSLEGAPVFQATLCGWSEVLEQRGEIRDVQARSFSWNYPHLQGIVFAEISATADQPSLPALALEDLDGVELREWTLRPHDGTGHRGAVRLDAWQRHDESGYLAVLRLDRAQRDQSGSVHAFTRGRRDTELRWPMAVVTAPTGRELEDRIAQALLVFDGAGSREDPDEWWRVPSLCGLCQQQRVTEVELDLQDRESSLLLRVRTRVEYPDHASAVAEGMQIEGHSLTPYFSGEQGDEAWFVVPVESVMADVLMAVAISGDARVVARLATGETRDVPTVRVQLDPAFQERLYAADQDRTDLDWPNHLSADLVSSWPNPFRESTTIEITVPGTIGEAFDLEPELLARVDPESEPPFGAAPSVRVRVYNVSGQLVKVLDENPRTTGRFTVGWNGQDLHGRLVASGTYYVHVEMDEWSVTRRVLLLRN